MSDKFIGEAKGIYGIFFSNQNRVFQTTPQGQSLFLKELNLSLKTKGTCRGELFAKRNTSCLIFEKKRPDNRMVIIHGIANFKPIPGKGYNIHILFSNPEGLLNLPDNPLLSLFPDTGLFDQVYKGQGAT